MIHTSQPAQRQHTIVVQDNRITSAGPVPGGMNLEDDLGAIEPGKLADLIILDKDPVAYIRALQGGRNLGHGHKRRQDRGPWRHRRQRRRPAVAEHRTGLGLA